MLDAIQHRLQSEDWFSLSSYLQRDAQRVDQEVQICSAEFQGGGERLHDISPPDAATSFLDTSITRADRTEIDQEPVVLGQAFSET